jgi:hypothetical protein
MDDNSVAAFAIFCIFGLPIAAWILFRIFRFVERMAMIARGIVPPPDGRGSRQYRDWARGAQTGPVPGQAPWQSQPYVSSQPQPQAAWMPGGDEDAQNALFKGIRLTLIGFAILIGLSFIGGTPGSADFRGGPWLLGGLIPMFVGVAQIIIALLSGAQFPGSQRATFGPPPGPSAPPPAAPPSGAWEQPRGPRLEELSKPLQPPDLR